MVNFGVSRGCDTCKKRRKKCDETRPHWMCFSTIWWCDPATEAIREGFWMPIFDALVDFFPDDRLASILENGITNSAPSSNVGVYSPGAQLVTKGALPHSLGTGVLCPPFENFHRRSLDQIIIKLSPLTSRAEALLAQTSPSVEALLQLQEDLLALNDEIVYWPDDRPSVWNPKLVGYVSLQGFCFSGPVEEYFDLYVAAAWNSWRSTHIIYIDHLVHVAKALVAGKFKLFLALLFDQSERITAKNNPDWLWSSRGDALSFDAVHDTLRKFADISRDIGSYVRYEHIHHLLKSRGIRLNLWLVFSEPFH
ncbi:hypothetical protein HG530_015024 [Fusarium avenaceum]|nr:hypothetical protein HG530_015024 [Fusarium avenaceum]